MVEGILARYPRQKTYAISPPPPRDSISKRYRAMLGGMLSEMGRIWFRRARFQTPSSVSCFGPHRIPGRELGEFLSAYCLCARDSPSLTRNSVSSSETVLLNQEQKKPKEKVFGPDIPRTSQGHSCGRPGSKTSCRPSHLGADIHDPNAWTSMTLRGAKKLLTKTCLSVPY